MTAKTTKKRLAPLWILACMVLIGICVFCYYFDASPLGAYELDTCTVGVYDYAGEAILETLSDDERDALAQRLREAELSHFVVLKTRATAVTRKRWPISTAYRMRYWKNTTRFRPDT